MKRTTACQIHTCALHRHHSISAFNEPGKSCNLKIECLICVPWTFNQNDLIWDGCCCIHASRHFRQCKMNMHVWIHCKDPAVCYFGFNYLCGIVQLGRLGTTSCEELNFTRNSKFFCGHWSTQPILIRLSGSIFIYGMASSENKVSIKIIHSFTH